MPSNTGSLSQVIFDALVQPGPRLPWIEKWLLDEVWSDEKFRSAQDVVHDYLIRGEKQVKNFEDVLSSAAQRVYDELLIEPLPERDLHHFLTNNGPSAAVVFDGLSLREMPLLLRMAEQSGFHVIEYATSLAAVPCDTLAFTQQRLRLNTRVAPSSLPNRSELRTGGISCFYYDSVRTRRSVDETSSALLLWSAFPDQTYRDSEARFDRHFANLQVLLETAWQNTVQQIPSNRTILITSDHGYIYFGAGCASARSSESLRLLNQRFGGERHCEIESDDVISNHPDIKAIENQQVAMIRGRVQTHTSGQDAAKLYKHGGLSLMEMITPWMVLTK